MKIILNSASPSARRVYATADIRQLEQAAIADGVAGIKLMKQAGRAAFALLLECFPSPELITVYCGSGNNAGDGYVLAALAAQRRIPVTVVQVASPERLHNEALQAYEFALQENVTMVPFAPDSTPQAGVIVDALLGIGVKGAPEGAFTAAIEQINTARLPVLALDLPCGLLADTGACAGSAVTATLTITFIGLKRGLVTGRGPALCGDLYLADLDVVDVRDDAALPHCL